MKTLRNLFLSILLLGGLVLTPGMTCTPSQQTLAYKSIYSVEIGATAAFDGYLTAVVHGSVSTNSLPAISHSYNALQLAVKTATLAVQGDANAPAPAALQSQSSNFITEISNAR
jgi:hypothetical protein